MGAGPGVDEIDAGQIPSGDAHGGANERAVRGRELVADAFDGEGPVAFALSARDLHAKRAAERVTRRARAADAGPSEATLERSLLDLAVEAAVVLLLDPGLRGAVEELERELGLALEHGHEAPLDLGPEDLLFPILLGGCRQGDVLDDGEALEALLGFCGGHRRPSVAEDGARQSALLESLAEAVDERLGVLLYEVPLGVAAEARAIVEDAEQEWFSQLAARQRDRALRLVEVEVPKTVDVSDLERAALTGNEAGLGLVAARLAALAEAVMLHVPTDRGVARHGPHPWILSRDHGEIVPHELVAPPRVVAAQLADLHGDRVRDGGVGTGVLVDLALEGADGILLGSSRIEPSLDGLGAEVDSLVRRRMPPPLRGEVGEVRPEIALLGRHAQERADDREAQSCPAHARRRARVVGHDGERRRSRSVATPGTLGDVEIQPRSHLLREPHDSEGFHTKRAESGTDPVVAGASHRAAAVSTSAAVDSFALRISAASRSSKDSGSFDASGGGGANRARMTVQSGDCGNSPCHHVRHRWSVRRGTPVTRSACRITPITSTRTEASSTTASQYTRRPRNRTDGGSARRRHPRRPQQSENRIASTSSATIQPPRGFRR